MGEKMSAVTRKGVQNSKKPIFLRRWGVGIASSAIRIKRSCRAGVHVYRMGLLFRVE